MQCLLLLLLLLPARTLSLLHRVITLEDGVAATEWVDVGSRSEYEITASMIPQDSEGYISTSRLLYEMATITKDGNGKGRDAVVSTTLPFCSLLLPPTALTKTILLTLSTSHSLTGSASSHSLRVSNKSTRGGTSDLCVDRVSAGLFSEQWEGAVKLSHFNVTHESGDVVPLSVRSSPPPGLKRLDNGGNNSGGLDAEEGRKKSFLGRYWWVILPLVLVSLTGGDEGGKR